MKILLSAYACEPNKGSEPEVGWKWASELARRGYKVWVLTRANNKTTFESMKMKLFEKNNIRFLYYDLPTWTRLLKKFHFGIYFYYFFWQLGAYKFVKKIHKKFNFNLIHHVTFASICHPSFLGYLGIPFIFGPVAGGEKTPLQLRYNLGLKCWLTDFLRDLINFSIKINPFMWKTFYHASQIFVTSEETLKMLPKRFREKAQVQLAIGIERPKRFFLKRINLNFRVLYVGRFIYWKGMKKGIYAFARLLETVPKSMLTMVGTGPEEKKWKNLAINLGINERIDWLPWTEQDKLYKIYSEHDVFLFPSLHDSGGHVVLEALAHGLPIVCLDLGGPKEIVNRSCGFKLPVKDLPEEKVVENLYAALKKLAIEKKLRAELSIGAVNRIKDFTWTSLAKNIYKDALP